MNSSSSDNGSDMFPAAETGIQNQHSAQSRPIDPEELSPPASQDTMSQENAAAQPNDPMDISNALTNSNQLQPKNEEWPSIRAEQKKAPGSAWNNRKARDDYARAMETVVDKNFSLSTALLCAEFHEKTLLITLQKNTVIHSPSKVRSVKLNGLECRGRAVLKRQDNDTANGVCTVQRSIRLMLRMSTGT